MPLEKLRDRIHRSLDQRLLPLCRVLARFGVRPNQITLIGTLVCLAGAVLVATDRLVLGGLVWLAGSTLDMLDGALARSHNQVSRGGAFLDSIPTPPAEMPKLISNSGSQQQAEATTAAITDAPIIHRPGRVFSANMPLSPSGFCSPPQQFSIGVAVSPPLGV